MRYRELLESGSPEDWTTYLMIYGKRTNIGWSLSKDALNRRSHNGLGLRDGIPALTDPNKRTAIQTDEGEERELHLGRGAGGRLLVVVVSWIDEGDYPALRIISVRYMDSGDKAKVTEEVQGAVDPDNPPLTGDEHWVPAREHFLAKYAEVEKRIAIRKAARAEGRPAAE